MTHTPLRDVLPWKASGTAWGIFARAGTLVLALALLLAGCSEGGSTRTGGYTCVAAPQQYGCWTQLSISPTHLNPDGHTDIPAVPLNVQSDLWVVPVTCDAACQASSGSGNPPGYIANFIQLWQQSTGWFIRAGYETTAGGTQYFAQYWLGDVSPPSGNLYLGPTHVDSGFLGAYPSTTIVIAKTYASPNPQWVVGMSPGYPAGASLLEDMIGASGFQPNWVFYGQVVYGTSGATAKLAIFTNNEIDTGERPQALREDGTPPGTIDTADHPADAEWYIHPGGVGYGGMFYVSCCQPFD
jgi:hypothetical protein